MKNYDEIAENVFRRRDEYVARQKQIRKTALRVASVACSFVLVALLGLGVAKSGWLTPDTPPVTEEPATTQPTENLDGTGGDGEECQEHNFNYHWIDGNFTSEEYDVFHEWLGEEYDKEDFNICNFIEVNNITREEYMEDVAWTEEGLDEIAWSHGNGCPYTRRQWLDALFGDNAELTAWVLAPSSTWPEAENWSLSGNKALLPEEWPPEGYGFGETPVAEEPVEEIVPEG